MSFGFAKKNTSLAFHIVSHLPFSASSSIWPKKDISKANNCFKCRYETAKRVLVTGIFAIA